MKHCLTVLIVVASVTWTSQSRAQDITTGLVHHWKFDESGSAEAAVDSAGSNLATLGGYQSGDPRWEPGVFGNALRLSRSSNYALTVDPINMNQYTVALWINRVDESGVNPRVVTPQDASWIAINDEHDLGLGIGSVRSLIPPELGEWEHYAVAFDVVTDEVDVYKNGSLVRTGTVTSLEPNNNLWIFGHNQDVGNGNDTFNGLLDDLRIYNRLLEPEDVAKLATIPEPSTLALMAIGFLALAVRHRRRR